MCKVYQNEASLERYYNYGKTCALEEHIRAGISNLVIKNENGELSCSFRREKIMTGVEHYTNLNNPTYILMAKGSVTDSIKYKKIKFYFIRILNFFYYNI